MMSSIHAKRDPSVDPLIGQTLANRYLIKRLIGAGGVGLVYLAQDNEANRPVVVKVLAPNWADNDEALASFEREARRLNDLEHPNIVRLFSFGNENGRAYIVMEYADGELLSSYVKRKGRLELKDFVPIASQILKGMGYAHARGLMLRDVKPANIMLTATGGRANFVKLLDFGLAKLIEGDAEITQQHVVGTAAYLSPEQIKGEDLDLRVDVYAVGVLFYFMLTGRLPFEADNTANVFYKHVNEPPPPLSETLEPGHDVPDELIEVIHRCLEKDREERPADANEIVEGLIDAVPDLSMFKLPRVAGSGEAISDTFAVTDTGVHSLRPSGAPLKSGAHPVSADTPLDEDRSGAVAVATATAPETSRGTSKTGLYIGIAAAAVVVLGIAGFALSRGGEDPGEAAAVSGAASSGDVDVTAQIAAVEQLVDEGKFNDALAKLDGMAAALDAEPSMAGKAKQLRLAAESGKLMVTGQKLEENGDLEAARDVFASVVEMDASNADARSAVARLDKQLALTAGKLSVEISPPAYVSIGGKDKGKTPLDLDLQPGEYELVITADGYVSKTEKVEVAKGETVRLKTSLRRAKKRRGGTPTPTPTPAGTGGAAPDPEPKPKPKPEPEPEPETTKPEKTDPFLPAKKSGKNDGFLPTR